MFLLLPKSLFIIGRATPLTSEIKALSILVASVTLSATESKTKTGKFAHTIPAESFNLNPLGSSAVVIISSAINFAAGRDSFNPLSSACFIN